MTETLKQARDTAACTCDVLRAANRTATPVEHLIVLQLTSQAEQLRQQINALLDAIEVSP